MANGNGSSKKRKGGSKSGSGSESDSGSDTSSRYTLLFDAYFCTICLYNAFGYFHHDLMFFILVAFLCSNSSGSDSSESESESEKDVKSKTKKSKKSKVYRIVSVMEISSVTLSG